ncbi:MAG: HAD family hydrolase [Lachnospiraceae bacterium]|nr:HAD family hydrolase [Lachnospiraceae bacterium]
MIKHKTILFDLYGTLVDIHTDEGMYRLWRTLSEFYAAHGAKYSPSELKESYFRLVREAEDKLMAKEKGDAHEAHPEIDLAQVFRKLYSDRGVKNVSDKLLEETAAFIRKASTTHERLYAGVAELLTDLRRAGKQVILLSNAQHLFTVPELKDLGIYDLFDRIYISSDYSCKKPDSRFFLKPVEELGLEPSECLMIGNDPNCDVKGALGVGMDAYYIHSALSPKPCPDRKKLGLPDERFQSHMDLKLVRRRLLGE